MKNHQLQVSIYPVTDLLTLSVANAAETISSVRHHLPYVGHPQERTMPLFLSLQVRMLLQRIKGAVGGKSLSSFRNVERLARSNGWHHTLMEELVMKDVEEASSLGIMCGALALKQVLVDHLNSFDFILTGPIDEALDKIDDIDGFIQSLYCELMSIETLIEGYANDRVIDQFEKEGIDIKPSAIRPVLLSPTNLIGILSDDNIGDILTQDHLKAAALQNRVQMGRLWLEEITDSMVNIGIEADQIAESKIAVAESIQNGIRTMDAGLPPDSVFAESNAKP